MHVHVLENSMFVWSQSPPESFLAPTLVTVLCSVADTATSLDGTH